jgi:hypothetical protein
MKKTIKFVSLAVTMAVVMVSCDLDRFPYDSIEQTQAFKTMNDAASLRNGLYSQLRGRVGGIYQFSTDVQADQMNATLDFGNRNGAPHRWITFLADDYTIRDVWRYSYNSIANINNFIGNIGLIETKSEDDEAEIDNYVGEAYLMRAFYYHRLVQRWGKDYEPATAASDLGVPLVLDYNVTLLPARATVKAVYDQIIADIAEAKTRLADVPGEQAASRFTLDAAYALEARVKLCMHDFTGAAAAADFLTGSNRYPLINTVNGLEDMWTNDVGTEIICQLYASSTELSNANDIYMRYTAAINRYQPDFVPSQWVVDMFEDTDIRKTVYFSPQTIQIQGTDYTDVYLVSKFPGNPELFTAATSNYQHKPKLFNIAEMYLISAEAKAMTPATEGAALADLNTLRVNRGLAALTGLAGTALRDAIREERTRELFAEGFRLDDLSRWNLGFSRSAPQNTAFINITPSDDFHLKTVAAGADKMVWGIPTNDITTNPNIAGQQNQGW